MRTAHPRPPQGITLVEASICLAAFGLICLVFFATLFREESGQQKLLLESSTLRIQSAISAYAMTHGRLPCPSGSADPVQGGTEDCGRTQGYVPIKTLGLPMPVAAKFGYSVDEAALEQVSSVQAMVLNTQGAGITMAFSPSTLASFTGPDRSARPGVVMQNFCEALQGGQGTASSAAYRLTPQVNADGDGVSTVVARSSLWASLNCGQLRSHGLRGYASVHGAIEYATQSFDDRYTIWVLDNLNYLADTIGGVIWLTLDIEGLLRALAQTTAATGSDECGDCGATGASTANAATVTPRQVLSISMSVLEAVQYWTNQAWYLGFLAQMNLVRLEFHALNDDSRHRMQEVLSNGYGL